jgi:lysophospholipase L1-like esterase
MIVAMNTYNKTSQEVAAEHAVPFVDIASALPKNLDYFTDDIHYTPKANALIAKLLFTKIVTLDLIK